MTQFPEVRLGEKRTHQFLIVARNSNTSQSTVPLLPKRIHLWLSVAKKKRKVNTIAKVHSFNKYLLSSFYVLGPPRDLHTVGAQ